MVMVFGGQVSLGVLCEFEHNSDRGNVVLFSGTDIEEAEDDEGFIVYLKTIYEDRLRLNPAGVFGF